MRRLGDGDTGDCRGQRGGGGPDQPGGEEDQEERAPGVGSEEGAYWSGPLTPGLTKGCLRPKMDGTGAALPFVAGDEREQALSRAPHLRLAPLPLPVVTSGGFQC